MFIVLYIIFKGLVFMIYFWVIVLFNGFILNVIWKSDVVLFNEDRRRGFDELFGNLVIWNEFILVLNLYEKR